MTATGKSILNRSSNTDIGALMLEYGGGGHENAGTCQVSNEMAEDVLGRWCSGLRRKAEQSSFPRKRESILSGQRW